MVCAVRTYDYRCSPLGHKKTEALSNIILDNYQDKAFTTNCKCLNYLSYILDALFKFLYEILLESTKRLLTDKV